MKPNLIRVCASCGEPWSLVGAPCPFCGCHTSTRVPAETAGRIADRYNAALGATEAHRKAHDTRDMETEDTVKLLFGGGAS